MSEVNLEIFLQAFVHWLAVFAVPVAVVFVVMVLIADRWES